MPQSFSAGRIQANHAIGEEIVAFASASVKIRRGRPGPDKNETALFIDGRAPPIIGRPRNFPSVAFPALMTDFARTWNRMKPPALPAHVNIESARIARCRPASFRTRKTHNYQIAPNSRRGGRAVVNSLKITFHSLAQVDSSVVAKSVVWFASFCIQRDQAAIRRAQNDA